MPDAKQTEGNAGCPAGRVAQRRSLKRGQPVVPPCNPFSVLGTPLSPMRMMFAPLEFALYLPAYAIDTFQGHGPRR